MQSTNLGQRLKRPHELIKLKTEAFYNNDYLQEVVNNNLPGYRVLDHTFRHYGKYGRKCYVLLKCPITSHKPYWTSLSVIKKGHPCRKCIETPEYLTPRKQKIIEQACLKNSCKFLNIVPMNKTRFQSVVVKVEDNDGLWYNVTLDHLRNRKMEFNFKFVKNPYAVHNIQMWCKKYRPDYLFCDFEFNNISEIYTFKYIGDEIIFQNDNERKFTTSLNNFIYCYTEHPYIKAARKSYGADLIKKFLRENVIIFEMEKTFPNLTAPNKAHLFFDFYLSQLKIAIEVDGIQHYKPIEHFGGQQEFQRRIVYDKIKDDFCKENNILLLRIPYYSYGSKKEPKTDYLLLLNQINKK